MTSWKTELSASCSLSSSTRSASFVDFSLTFSSSPRLCRFASSAAAARRRSSSSSDSRFASSASVASMSAFVLRSALSAASLSSSTVGSFGSTGSGMRHASGTRPSAADREFFATTHPAGSL